LLILGCNIATPVFLSAIQMDILEVPISQLCHELVACDRSPLSVKRGSTSLFFVVDIGASNSRFGFAARGGSKVYIRFVKVSVNSIVALIAAFKTFAEKIGESVCKRIVSATLNLPGPVQGSVGGPISNYLGSTSEEKTLHLSALPASLCPPHHTVMLNDLEACAYGVVATHHFKIFSKYFKSLWKGTIDPKNGNAEGLSHGNCVVVAPGTGLGIAVVQYHAFSGKYTVIPLEFGHTSVQSETDRKFVDAYKADLKRGNYAPEYDDICSGRGLERLYAFVLTEKGYNTSKKATAKEISDLARNNDPLAVEAVELYHKFLMRVCSQMAIGFVPHTFVLCGDNVVHNQYFYERKGAVETMKQQMFDHSCERYGFMSKPSMLRQSAFGNLNLLGCMYVCEGAARKESKL
jgi:glucokinase